MTNKPLTALETILVSIDTIGLAPTAAVLQGNLERHRLGEETHAATKFVMDMVARIMKIPVGEIRTGVLRKIDRRYAIGFCAYLLHTLFEYEMKMVGQLIGSSESICYKYSKLIRDLRLASPADKKYVQWRTLFERKVADYIQTR